tara:strand:+ start:516 stop:1433 length:918 start_codon:yes stop_codon:yes gene_type:complete
VVNIAAIDFGSNSTRLLIADIEKTRLVKKLKKHKVTGMAKNIYKTNLLSEESIERVKDALDEFYKEIKLYEVEVIYAIGTSAMRDSNNANYLVEFVKQTYDIELEILTGEEEAKLTYYGSQYGLNSITDCIVVDIGGGSTEVINVSSKNINTHSYQLGVVRISDQVLKQRPVVGYEEKEAIELIKSLLLKKNIVELVTKSTLMLGTGGTFTSLAAMYLNLPSYDNGDAHLTHIDKTWIDDFYSKLRLLSEDEIIAQYTSLDPQRSGTITPGTLIVKTFMEFFKINKLLVSENDILEGLILKNILD